MSVVSTKIRITVNEDVYRIFVLSWISISHKDFANHALARLRVPGGPLERAQLGAVAPSRGAFGSIPGSPGFSSSFLAPTCAASKPWSVF
jgi:hypothetical protein